MSNSAAKESRLSRVKSRAGASLRQIRVSVRRAGPSTRWMLYGAIAVLVSYIILALFAGWIAPYSFDQYSYADGTRFPANAPPSWLHPFGTNRSQNDVLSIVIYGSRTALQVVALAVSFSIILGVFLGLVAGYFGGILDRILVLVSDALYAFPALLFAIVIAFLLSSVTGGGVMTAALAITVVYIPQYFRVVRSAVISGREEPYVIAAEALGARPRTVISRYLFSNVVLSVPVIATLNAADGILTLAGLGFLGYGIQPTQAAEWGYELQRAIADVGSGVWWTGTFPGLAIVGLVMALTFGGEALSEVFNPALRVSRRVSKKRRNA